jgi:hypothetical protein
MPGRVNHTEGKQGVGISLQEKTEGTEERNSKTFGIVTEPAKRLECDAFRRFGLGQEDRVFALKF